MVATEWIWSPYACLDTVREKIANTSGLDFEVVETDCDVLAKDAATSIFISTRGQTTRELMFKYVPSNYAAVPLITAIDDRTIRVSIERVSDVLCRNDTLQSLTIEYVIGIGKRD